MTATKANGWQVTTVAMPSANLAAMAAGAPGPSAYSAGGMFGGPGTGGAGLFD